MKKLIYTLALIILIASCKKDEVPEVPDTTYEIINNMEHDPNPAFEYLDGSIYEVTAYCFDNTGDVVREDNIEKIQSGGGTSGIIKVTDNIVKVVVSFRLLPPESDLYDLEANGRKYTVTRFVITPEQNNEIELTGDTTVKNTLAILSNSRELLIDAFKL